MHLDATEHDFVGVEWRLSWNTVHNHNVGDGDEDYAVKPDLRLPVAAIIRECWRRVGRVTFQSGSLHRHERPFPQNLAVSSNDSAQPKLTLTLKGKP